MKKLTAVFCVLAALAVSMVFANHVYAKELEQASDFNLPDLEQNAYLLSRNQDKNNVLLVFWTTWCPFCSEELQRLNKVYQNLSKEGLEVVAVNVGERQNKVAAFVKRYNLSYKVLLDTSASVSKSFSVIGVPTYVLIDKKGRIVFTDNYFPEKEYKKLISK